MASEQRSSNLGTTALYVGVPVLLGASCYYLYHTHKNKSTQNGPNKQVKQLTPKEQMAQLKQTGNHNFSRKNYDVAIDSYTRAIELSKTLSPDSIKPDELAIFYQNRAACSEALGDYEKVISDCDIAIKLKNDYVKAYVRRAKAYEKMQNYEKALLDAYCAALLDKFQNQTSMILTENIVKASSKQKAAAKMKDRVPSWPANHTIKNYFAAFTQDPIKLHLNNPVNMTSELLDPLYKEAVKPENDNDPFSLIVRGSCQCLMGDLKSARDSFDKLLSLECTPRYKANVLIKKAALVMNEPTNNTTTEKEFENVTNLLEQALSVDPENPDIYLHKSQALTLNEKFDEAVVTLKRAVELKEDFYTAIAQKLYLEFKIAMRDQSSDIDKIKGLLSQAVADHPESSDLHHIYAQVLTELNLFEQADQVLLDLGKLDPTDGNIHLSRALLQFHMKNDRDEVARMLREALKVDPNMIFAYELLGSIETQQGNIDEAIKIFESAVDHAQTEAEFARAYSLVDSAISQRAAAELLGMSI